MPRKGDTQAASRASAAYTSHAAARHKKSIESVTAAAKRKKIKDAAAQRKASIEATKELMSDPDVAESLERSEEDLKAGRMKSWSQVKSEL